MSSHYLVELYSPKPAWLGLSDAARQDFFLAIGAAMPTLSALGVEPLAFGRADQTKPHAAGQSYFALWRCPNAAALDALIEGIAQSGWHDYFTTVNSAGQGMDLLAHAGDLCGAAPG